MRFMLPWLPPSVPSLPRGLLLFVHNIAGLALGSGEGAGKGGEAKRARPLFILLPSQPANQYICGYIA